MNVKSLIIAIIVAFLVVFGTDFLIHGVWLSPIYGATKHLWRPESEMQGFMPWLSAGQFLAAASFSLLWAVGFAEKAKLSCAVKYGLVMGLFMQANTLITYAVMPLTPEIAVKWFCAGLVQSVILGLVLFFVYKPRTAVAPFAP